MKLSETTSLGIDWLTFSLVGVSGARCSALTEAITAKFGSEGIATEKLGHGYLGIDLAVYGCLAQRTTKSGRGVDLRIDLPGLAMQQIRNEFKMPDAEIVGFFVKAGFRCTRIDLTVDSTDEAVDVHLVKRHWNEAAVTCAADEARPYEPRTKKGEVPGQSGWTFYIGSPQSSRMMRVYDKQHEVLEKFGLQIPHTTRFELQTRHEAAEEAAKRIASEGVNAAKRIIAGWISFRTLRGRQEVKKRKIADWWQAIIGEEKESLALDPRIATPQRTLNWIKSEGVIRSLKLALTFGKWDEIQRELEKTEIPDGHLQRWRAAFGAPVAWCGPAAGFTEEAAEIRRRVEAMTPSEDE